MEKINIEQLFIDAKGGPIEVNGRKLISLDKFKMPQKKMSLKFNFLEIDSKWKQGFVIKTKGSFSIDEQEEIKNAIVLWEDTAPKEGSVEIKSVDGLIVIYNVWDVGDGVTQAWHNGAAMEVKIDSSTRTYYCNDGYPDLDFNDLVFRISW
ncbi:hypothetical protein [Ekhidna sp.]|uniref:hypothetical protein n=1 Tax=Ekhidna sp. TaxID=2608089 RepID=UPI0032975C8C